ncbi:MAG: SpoIID/LytB domain-containing protein [Lachnospiraceae bacterium]|nr:SpoIID/LytB domain-containing protein [Lachnospiraceae bacterium]
MKSSIKNIILVLLALCAIAVIITEVKSRFGKKQVNNEDEATVTEAQIDMSMYYSFADVKGEVSYLANSSEEEEALSRLIDVLNQSQPINVGYVRSVCETIGVDSEVYADEIGGKADEEYVSKEQFDSIYENIQASGTVDGLGRFDIYVFEVRENIDEDGNSRVSVFDGFNEFDIAIEIPDEYMDKVIDVYIKNGSIYKINGYGDDEVVFDNAWVENADSSGCTFLYKGIEKNYENNSGTTSGKNFVAKITIDNSGVKLIEKQPDISTVKISSVREDGLNTDNGFFKTSENFVIYNTYGDSVLCENNKETLKGYKQVDIVKSDNMVLAVVVNDELINDDIRVIISNDDYTSYDMEKVILTCDKSYNVEYPDEETTAYNANDRITIRYSDYEDGDIIKVSSDEGGNIEILSIERAYGNPIYSGSFEIVIGEENLNLINVVPLETYLYSVLSSEMPAGAPDEALKALAVVYRAYAYGKLTDGSFDDYYANLDDSSLCQLYNSYEIREDCVQAVKDTYGIIPVYEEGVIVPFSYLTSYGMRCTNSEIWGGSDYEYYVSEVDDLGGGNLDLSDEDSFRQFLSDSMGYETIDMDMPYYRWHIDFTFDEMTAAVNSTLDERSASSGNIMVKLEDGSYDSLQQQSLGDVLDITITERSISGAVISYEIEGSESVISVTGPSNIRNLITPVNQQIVRQDDSAVSNWTSLPSVFYYIDKTDTGFTIYGGGFGYGVGVSETGAQALAEAGYDFQYILKHYFNGITFDTIYDNSDEEEILEDE